MIDIFDIIKKDICMQIAIKGEIFSRGVPYNKNNIKALRKCLYENENEVEIIQFEAERANISNFDEENYFIKFTIIANVTEVLYDKIMMDMGDFIQRYDIELNKVMDYASQYDGIRRRVPAGDFGLGSLDADGDTIILPYRQTDMRNMFQNATTSINLDEITFSGRRLH